MNKECWKEKIIEACKAAGTYKDFFDSIIESLAEILEKRDEAEENYRELGSKPIIMYTNKGGATNPSKNPALIVWDALNKSALAYWRDLGLTPAGLKKIDESAMTNKKHDGFEEALAKLGI